MNDWRSGPDHRHDVITVRVIWVAFALSLVAHIAALWTAPPLMRPLAFDPVALAGPARSLMARLAPPSTPADKPPPAVAPSPPAQASDPIRSRIPKSRPAAPVPSSPPPIARTGPGPAIAPVPPAPPTAVPPTAVPSVEGDLSAYIAARRSARGETTATVAQGRAPDATSVEDEKERLNRVVAANLGLNRVPTFGDDPKRGGGMFQLRRVGADDAEFVFNGWNPDIGRISSQMIEVRKGANPDIRVAVVRRIIEIIRAQEPGDFIWVSRRLGRQLALSARPADNAGLEEFMMREFFGGAR